jgi:hypothetical protein
MGSAAIWLPVTVVPSVELSVCRVSTLLSTVTVCVTAPTSRDSFAVDVSVTFTTTDETSDVLKPAALNLSE